jgi:phenylacetate-CoA ligase
MPDELADLVRGNLAATIAAIAATPATVARWPGVQSVENPSDLRRLPLLSPETLEDLCPPAVWDLVLDSAASGMVLRSSGTSGKRKTLYHSWPFNDRVAYLGARGVRAAVPHIPTRAANCLYPGELNGAFSFAQDLSRGLGAQTFPIGTSMRFAELIEVIHEHRIDTLIGSPAMGADLFADPANLPSLTSLRTFLYIGENLGAARAEVLANARPDLVVRSLSYSTSETGPIGYQCPHQGDGTHHVHEDAMVVQVIDPETGAEVADGEEGEVIVSTLTDTGMPLLRYQVGDRAIRHAGSDSCACGSHAARITLTGRVPRSFNVDGATISQDLVMARLRGFDVADPADCQFQVLRAPDRGFTIALLLSDRVSSRPADEEVLGTLREGYHLGRVFAMPGCKGFALRRVPRTEFATNSRGKIPFFVEI